MSGLKIVTAWATNVVSIADFKLFARIDSSDTSENALIESLSVFSTRYGRSIYRQINYSTRLWLYF